MRDLVFGETNYIVVILFSRHVYMRDDEVCALIVYSQRLQCGGLWSSPIAGKYLR